MTGAEWYVLALVLAAVLMFATEALPVDVVGMLVLVALILGEVVPLETALRGFANEALLTVAALFVVSEGVVRTGAIDVVSRGVAAISRGRVTLMLPLILVLVMVASAFVNNTPVVVLAVPLVIGLAEQYRFSPSKILMSVSFASILGGMCTLIGTSTNILINSAAHRPDGSAVFEPLGMFEFAPLGLVFSVVGLSYIWLFGDRLLPARKAADRLKPELLKEFLTEVRVGRGSPLVGTAIGESLLGEQRTLQLIRGEELLWAPLDAVVLQPGDRLMLKADIATVARLLRGQGLELPSDDDGEIDRAALDSSAELAAVGGRAGADEVHGREWTLAEIVLTPHSHLVGRTIERAAFRKHHGASVLAIQRAGEHIRGGITDVRLKMGDILLVGGDPEVIRGLRSERDFLVLAGAGEYADMPGRAPVAGVILAGVVGMAAFGVFPVVTCALLGAVAMIVSGCLSSQRAYQSIAWDILVLVACMIALGEAMSTEHTGLSRTLAVSATQAASTIDAAWRPHVVLAIFYLVVTVLSNLVSNNAVALLFVPLALETAGGLGVDSRPFLFAVAYGASAAFTLPIGYNTHLLVYGPGGYKLSDFVRFGGPLNLMLWLIAAALIPVFWPFHP